MIRAIKQPGFSSAQLLPLELLLDELELVAGLYVLVELVAFGVSQ